MPVIQVLAREPRHAAIQNLPARWTTMNRKKSWTDQKCRLLTNRPVLEVWDHDGPSKASTVPDRTIMASAASVRTPNTYIQEATYAGCVSGLSLIHISEPTRRTPISYAVFCLKK